MTETRYLVDGMTCEHCVKAVQQEVGALPDVTDVAVALVNGGSSVVTVTSDQPVAEETVREAVEEAGYTLVGTTV